VKQVCFLLVVALSGLVLYAVVTGFADSFQFGCCCTHASEAAAIAPCFGCRGGVVPHLVLGVKTRAAFAQDVDLESAVLGHACVVEFLGVFVLLRSWLTRMHAC